MHTYMHTTIHLSCHASIHAVSQRTNTTHLLQNVKVGVLATNRHWLRNVRSMSLDFTMTALLVRSATKRLESFYFWFVVCCYVQKCGHFILLRHHQMLCFASASIDSILLNSFFSRPKPCQANGLKRFCATFSSPSQSHWWKYIFRYFQAMHVHLISSNL